LNNTGIVTFAFGAPAGINSNIILARLTKVLAKELKELVVPIFTQFDIQLGLEPDLDVQRVKEVADQPPPTLRIARQAVKWAKQRNIKTLYVLAAKPHLWRALRDIKQAIRESGEERNIEIRTYGRAEQLPKDSWFCPDSTQERVRSRKAWNKREWLLKILPFWIYKKIAS